MTTPRMTPKEAALYAGRKSPQAYRWIIWLAKNGILKGDGVGFDGKFWTFTAEAIDNWLAVNARANQPKTGLRRAA